MITKTNITDNDIKKIYKNYLKDEDYINFLKDDYEINDYMDYENGYMQGFIHCLEYLFDEENLNEQ